VIASAVATFLSLPYLSFRPATMALVILTAIAALLLRERRIGATRAVWLVVPLTMLLANVHLVVVFAPLWAACLLWKDAKSRRAGTVMVSVILASLATPMLFGAIATAIHYQFHDVMVASPVIAEMQPIYRGAGGLIACAVVLAIAICLWRRRDVLAPGLLICIAIAAIFMFRAGRFAPIFAIVAAPALAATLPQLRDAALGRRFVLASMSVVLAVITIRIAMEFPRSDRAMSAWLNRNAPPVEGFPCAAADFVAAKIPPRSARLLNEFNWGGYLEWRLGDAFKVLLDGRTQVFSADLWTKTYLSSPQQMQGVLAKATADAAIVPARKSQFSESLKQLGWTRVYSDAQAEVLVPPNSDIADLRD
jgi:hypothetical protein